MLQAENDCKDDGAKHQKCVTAYKENKTRRNSDAVASAKGKLDDTKARFDSAYQAVQRFKDANSGSMGEIEKRAAELKKTS